MKVRYLRICRYSSYIAVQGNRPQPNTHSWNPKTKNHVFLRTSRAQRSNHSNYGESRVSTFATRYLIGVMKLTKLPPCSRRRAAAQQTTNALRANDGTAQLIMTVWYHVSPVGQPLDKDKSSYPYKRTASRRAFMLGQMEKEMCFFTYPMNKSFAIYS